MLSTVFCYKCHEPLEMSAGSKVHRSEKCPHCASSIYCCKMCIFYDPLSYNECREPNAERILEKEKTNFCDFYHIEQKDNNKNNNDQMLSKANALFKK